MKIRMLIAASSILLFGLGAAPAAALTTSEYIVSLHSDQGLRDSRLAGKKLHNRWTHALNGLLVALAPDEVSALRANPYVAAVEPNRKRTLKTTQTISPNHNIDNWALDALQGGAPALDGSYSYESTGSGVTIAVVDTGVFPNDDLGSRLVLSKNFVDGANGFGSAKDCNGHGTHVASIAAGTKFGVAKGANIYNLRVLDCYGSGWDSDITTALDWLAANKPVGRTVVNMSIGGSGAYDITSAVDSLIYGGISVAVAAGNEAADACDGMIIPKLDSGKPTSGVFTVGAYASNSQVSWFSNVGTCVDLFAPGSDILSRTIALDPLTEEPLIDPITRDFIPVNEAWSGTSMATPVVVGAIARYLEANPTHTPAQIEDAFIANAAEGQLDFSGSDYYWWDETLAGSPNLVLDFSAFELPTLEASIATPASLSYGESGPISVTSNYSNPAELSVTGDCHVSEDLLIADKGVGTCTVSATFPAEPGYAGRTVSSKTLLELAVASARSPISEPGWTESTVVPQKQTLSLLSAPNKVSGACKVYRLVLTANASSGECSLSYNPYNDGFFSYPKNVVKIKLGTPTQSWTTKVTRPGSLKFSGRAIQLAAATTPISNYGYSGQWSAVTGPCTLNLSNARNGATVIHNGARGQVCTVSLSAPSAFKLAALTTSWTITR